MYYKNQKSIIYKMLIIKCSLFKQILNNSKHVAKKTQRIFQNAVICCMTVFYKEIQNELFLFFSVKKQIYFSRGRHTRYVKSLMSSSENPIFIYNQLVTKIFCIKSSKSKIFQKRKFL